MSIVQLGESTLVLKIKIFMELYIDKKILQLKTSLTVGCLKTDSINSWQLSDILASRQHHNCYKPWAKKQESLVALSSQHHN